MSTYCHISDCNLVRTKGRQNTRDKLRSIQPYFLDRKIQERNLSSRGKLNKSGSVKDYLLNLSPRQKANLEEEMLITGCGVIDPILKTNIAVLGWVRAVKFPTSSKIKSPKTVEFINQSSSIKVTLHLPTLLHPSLAELKTAICNAVQDQITRKAKNDDNFDVLVSSPPLEVEIKLSLSKPVPLSRNTENSDLQIKNLGPGLKNVGHFLAVYSCKGGVGKSTVAINLAYELARIGGRVGLLDLDVHGPSLPVLVKPEDPAVRRSPVGSNMVLPIEHDGVKLMSIGFVSPKSGVPGSGRDSDAAIMRGPMVGKVVTQLLKGTDWGSLDVLVLDMPPGTGDVQLTICQDLELSGAVSITTPSKLAVTDTKKGIDMFTSMGVPTLAVVENMSFFECEGGGKHYPFGKGLSNGDKFGLKNTHIFKMPLSSCTNDANDSGTPLCLSRPSVASVELSLFEQLSKSVANDLLLLQHGRSAQISKENDQTFITLDDGLTVYDVASLQLSVDSKDETFITRLFSDNGASQTPIPGHKLRSWHPKIGEPIENTNEVNDEYKEKTGCGSHSVDVVNSKLFPCKIEKKGIYGYSIEWHDGSIIIYSMISLAKAAGFKVV